MWKIHDNGSHPCYNMQNVKSNYEMHGSVHSKATAICAVDEAKKLGALLEYVGGTR